MQGVSTWVQALALFLCVLLAVYLGDAAVAANSSYGDKELPIYSVDTEEKKISISFDAAWGAEDFPKIMEVLDKHNVKTTFFMTGEWVEKYPEGVKILVEKGHDLGNHSATHPDMTTLSKEKQKEQILAVHNAVKELTGYEMELFRPPYGAYNNEVIRTCYELEYYPIQWSVDSLDWKGISADEIKQRVLKNISPGSIVLFHNAAENTPEALPGIIEALLADGYTIVPVSQILLKGDYSIDHTGRQIPK